MAKYTLVLGASSKPNRYSYLAIRRLLASGNQVYAIGSQAGRASGVEIYTKKELFKNIDTVTLYLNPLNQKEYYNYIVELQPKRVIFNPGTENQEFYELLKAHQIPFEESCTLVLLSTNQY